MDRLIVKIGYESYVCEMNEDTFTLVRALRSLTPVDHEYVGGEYLYFISEKNGPIKVEIEIITEKQFRMPTKEEKENEKIKDLECSLEYQKRELEKERAAKKAIECELKLMRSEQTPEKADAN